jgi:hypothetical protein
LPPSCLHFLCICCYLSRQKSPSKMCHNGQYNMFSDCC